LSALLTQICWTNNLTIMSKAKTIEERHFYITLCIKESYSSRELERQIESGYYERYMLSKEKLLPEPMKGLKENPFLDSYVIEFLDLPKNFKEADLRKGLIQNMKEFILEVGKDFTFVDDEFKVQVGGEDFRIDLLFYHRGLQCLVAFELKIGKFKPEYISKMDFYLEALDRQKKKENENPSVGMILCASKDDEVVEYAMSRTMSPMMVAEYKLQLPDKEVLHSIFFAPLRAKPKSTGLRAPSRAYLFVENLDFIRVLFFLTKYCYNKKNVRNAEREIYVI